MEAIYSEEEIISLQGQSWWVACNENPFLVKAIIHHTTILLMITDLRKVWATRIDEPTLKKQKQKFARTLEVSDFKELLTLFEGILTNPDKKALYQFIKKKDSTLSFRVEKQISVYPFVWMFDLVEIDYDIISMLCREILNPMTKSLNAQEKRCNIMKKKMQNMERQLLRKMSQVEKSYYRSPLAEDEDDLKLLVQEPKEEELVVDLRLESTSKFFFDHALIVKKPTKPQVQSSKEQKVKVEKRITAYTQPSGQQLLNQLEMKKKEQMQKKKTKRNVDFL